MKFWQESSLFDVGLNYVHGTGHGVGHFLNVHEGPYNKPLKPGMIITNEPGYYQDNEFGIRIENMLIWYEHTKFKDFYGFENITKFPYWKALIDIKILDKSHLEHINRYHQNVRESLTPLLNDFYF